MLETTVAGSLPKPFWLAEPEKLRAACRLEGDQLAQGKRDAILEIETPEQVASTLGAAMKHVDPERTYPCTNCGLAPLPRDVSIAKLRALGDGSRLARKQLRTSKKKSRKSTSGKKEKGGKGRK